MLKSGIYEQIINKELRSQLEVYRNNSEKIIQAESIDLEEASIILAKYLSEVIQKGLSSIKDNHKDINIQIDLCNRLIDTVVRETGEQALGELSVDKRAEMLLALIDSHSTFAAIK